MKKIVVFMFMLVLTLFVGTFVVSADNDNQTDIYFSDSIPSPIVLDYNSNIYYEINFSNYWVPLITREYSLPYWVRLVDNWRIKNENRTYDLDIYIYGSLFDTLEPGEISNWYPTGETLDIGFAMRTSANPLPPDTYEINGGFKFKDDFSSSDFYSSDINIDFRNYFAFPYNSGFSSYIDFNKLKFQNRDNVYSGAMYYGYDTNNSILAWSDYLNNGLGYWHNYNNPTLITQYIRFNNVVVSEEIYTWLNSVGTFGDYDYSDLPDYDEPSSGSSRFQWLINDIDAFMKMEPLPNMSFYDILLVFVSVPLLIYILKLFLGG